MSQLLPVNIYADAFIPAATLSNPGCIAGVCLPGSGGYPTFAGDNRGISSEPGASFRIPQAITVDASPGDSSPIISSQNNSGLTIGYDTSGNPHYGRAPTSGLTESATENANGVTVQINGSGSNPLVPAAGIGSILGVGSIVQQYTIDLSPAADDMIDYTVSGATKFFPGYELYIGCQLISGYDPASTGSGPTSLLNPFPTNSVVASGAISDSAADGCGAGSTQNFSISPTSISTIAGSSTYEFDNAPSGSWIDPVIADSFQYTMLSDTAFLHSTFTEIAGFPSDVCSSFEVYVGGVDEGLFHAGDTFQFPGGTTSFMVSGIDPACGAQPFPLQLDFSTATASFDITPLPLTSAPEPNSLALLGSGLVALSSLSVARRRPRRVDKSQGHQF